MPYKNPEDKKQWEREHREIRNARRRQSRLERQTNDFVEPAAPDPVSQQKSTNGWKMLAALAVEVGIALVGAFAGVKLPNSDRDQRVYSGFSASWPPSYVALSCRLLGK